MILQGFYGPLFVGYWNLFLSRAEHFVNGTCIENRVTSTDFKLQFVLKCSWYFFAHRVLATTSTLGQRATGLFSVCLCTDVVPAKDYSPVCVYVCRDVVPGSVYTYQVQTISARSESEPSPPLTHQLGAPYCGDGRIQR